MNFSFNIDTLEPIAFDAIHNWLWILKRSVPANRKTGDPLLL